MSSSFPRPRDLIRRSGLAALRATRFDRALLGLVLLSTLVSAFADPAAAGKSSRRGDAYQYRTGVTCGLDSTEAHGPTDGSYTTTLTLLNGGNGTAAIWVTFALSQRIGDTEPGAVSTAVDMVLEPSRALEMSCQELEDLFDRVPAVGSPDFFSGYLVLESSVPLEVEVTRTSTTASGSELGIDVERLAERRVVARQEPQNYDPALLYPICHTSHATPTPGQTPRTIYVDRIGMARHRILGDTPGPCPR